MSKTKPNPSPDPSLDGVDRVAVVDIGSNSVRLVVYDAPARLPVPMFNEKAQCALGLGLAASGRLNPDGIAPALDSVVRYTGLCRAMGVERVEMVATAAVRDAVDGPDFVARVESLTGHKVRTLSGEEEAKMAALGLLSGVPKADGLIGDLGGGSLDLVALNKGEYGAFATLPLGHLRLMELAKGDAKRAHSIVARELDALEWMDAIKGRTFYAAGGSWRSIARVLLEQIKHPLHMIDNFWIDTDQAMDLLALLSSGRMPSLKKVLGVNKKRIDTLSFAAIALAGLLERTRPRRLQFTGFGMREGVLLSALPEAVQHHDPLISALTTVAARTGRFSISGPELAGWMAPLFNDETIAENRLRQAACLMSDIGWNEHPDYRAQHAFERVLRVPYAGLMHADRALLALTVYVRYNGEVTDKLVQAAKGLLDEGQVAWASQAGLALRLAHTLSGSAPGVLIRTQLELDTDKGKLFLKVSNDDLHALVSDAVKRRLKTLAKSIGLKGKII